MNVVSNTSPLNYLVMVCEADVLPRLYGRICVPRMVVTELLAPGSPDLVRKWAQLPPEWLDVREPTRPQVDVPLHAGETHAIALALELKAERLIMDDYAGREAARSLGVPLVGTIGVLDLATERGLINLPEVVKRLAATNFRLAQHLIEEILQRDAVRRKASARDRRS